jgi:hypothetical protein
MDSRSKLPESQYNAPDETVGAVLAALEAQGSQTIRDEVALRYGVVTEPAFGAPMAKMFGM